MVDKARRFGLRLVLPMALLGGVVTAPTGLLAAGVSVEAVERSDGFTVTIDHAKLGDVLDRLSDRFGFVVEGLDQVKGGDELTMTVPGTPKRILERLLRNRNHLIVRSSDSSCGIAKLVIVNSRFGSPPPWANPADPYGEERPQD